MIRTLSVVLALAAVSCGGSSTPTPSDGGTSTGTFSCTITLVNSDPMHTTSCHEFTGFMMSAAQGACSGLAGTFATGMCPRAGTLGACRQAAVAGAVHSTWYYAETGQMPTAASVMAHCAAQTPAETYVAP